MKAPKIGILRGLQPRPAQIGFSKSFRKLKSVYLTDKELGNVNMYFFDPVKLIFGRTTHQSWVGVDKNKLEKASKDLNYIETYELYHFFSGQAADVSKKLKIPLITEVWTSFPEHPAYYLPPYAWTVKKVIKNTSLFVARSFRARDALIKLGVSASKIKVIYHGVNLTKFYPVKRKLRHLNGNQKTFLYVGTMDPYKGLDLILEAWRIYFESHPNDKLLIAGKGELIAEVKGTKGVKYFGQVDYDKLPEVYRQADIFMSPSVNRYLGPFLWNEEFFSYTLMEAMASGLSIIGSDCGGIPEEIGPENIVVRQHSISDLVTAMEKIEIKNSNRMRAERLFDLHKQTAKLEVEILKISV